MDKILIIKLGADGDVLRTIPIAEALKAKYPDSKIEWVTRGDISLLLKTHPAIDKVHDISQGTKEKFDQAYNFDVDKEAMELLSSVESKQKFGFREEEGYPIGTNAGAEYYLNTMFDDELKKNNKKTYQEMMFSVAELPYKAQAYQIYLTEKDKLYALTLLKGRKSSRPLVGVHMGASSRWPSKAWSEKKVKAFIALAEREGYDILLLGGPNEAEKHARLANELESIKIKAYRNNPGNTKGEFAAVCALCDAIVCADSLAMHLAIGLGKPIVGLFFCTSPFEVEGYGLVTKLVSPRLMDFFPEKSDQYDESLTESISESDVLASVRRVIQRNKKEGGA